MHRGLSHIIENCEDCVSFGIEPAPATTGHRNIRWGFSQPTVCSGAPDCADLRQPFAVLFIGLVDPLPQCGLYAAGLQTLHIEVNAADAMNKRGRHGADFGTGFGISACLSTRGEIAAQSVVQTPRHSRWTRSSTTQIVIVVCDASIRTSRWDTARRVSSENAVGEVAEQAAQRCASTA
jgi:hypothetical protein